MMTVLDLFSGIGGFSLGLERAGMRTVAFCEIDRLCQRVLRKHWPKVPIYDDIRGLTGERLCADGIVPDLLCGGFPCQDISSAGKRAGIDGERSGLWSEYARLIGELRPRYVIVENVAALLGRGLGRVLGDLATLGFDAEWHCIPASAVGAPHRRDRLWLVAHSAWDVRAKCQKSGAERERAGQGGEPIIVANAVGTRLEGRARITGHLALQLAAVKRRREVPDADRKPLGRLAEPRRQRGQWELEPDVGRVAHGVPSRVDRLRSLGNAVVPQIPELIGRAILSYEAERG